MGKQLTDQQWLDLIQECRTSGLTDAAWLRQNHPEITELLKIIMLTVLLNMLMIEYKLYFRNI